MAEPRSDDTVGGSRGYGQALLHLLLWVALIFSLRRKPPERPAASPVETWRTPTVP